MVTVMDMSAGKVLDEACNHNNDVYCDEVLYAAWAEAPKVDAGLAKQVLTAYAEQARRGLESFMARLSACQG